MRFGLAIGLMTATLLFPASVAARDFRAYQSTTPMLYRYAACALEIGQHSTESQLQLCAPLRDELLEEADSILPKFYSRDRTDAKRHFERGLAEIDKDAARSRMDRKATPRPLLAYLKCMGEGVMATEDYRLGIAVDYSGVEPRCVEDHLLSVTAVSTVSELERIQILYRRFARTERYLDNSRMGEGIALTKMGASQRLSRSPAPAPNFVVMDGGFLNLSLLPEDPES